MAKEKKKVKKMVMAVSIAQGKKQYEPRKAERVPCGAATVDNHEARLLAIEDKLNAILTEKAEEIEIEIEVEVPDKK